MKNLKQLSTLLSLNDQEIATQLEITKEELAGIYKGTEMKPSVLKKVQLLEDCNKLKDQLYEEKPSLSIYHWYVRLTKSKLTLSILKEKHENAVARFRLLNNSHSKIILLLNNENLRPEFKERLDENLNRLKEKLKKHGVTSLVDQELKINLLSAEIKLLKQYLEKNNAGTYD